MFGLGAATRIYLATGTTDMRIGFDGLHAMVIVVGLFQAHAGRLSALAHE